MADTRKGAWRSAANGIMLVAGSWRRLIACALDWLVLGAWGRFHARALRALPGVELTAVCCLRDATAAEARADLQGVPVVRTLPDLLRREPDVVDIVLPSHLQLDTPVAALAAGAHVILEKPLAITRSECDRILSMAARSGRQISVVHEMRVSPQWGSVKQEIDFGGARGGAVRCV